MKVSVCIEMIYTEVPFLDRIRLAAEQEFDGIEFWNWDNKDIPSLIKVVEETGLEIAAFQSNRGGTLINPAHRKDFISGIKESLDLAQELNCKAMFLLTDELGDDRSVKYQFPELSEEEKYNSVLEGLTEIAPHAEKAGVTLVMEPLNTQVDHAGYWLEHSQQGIELVRKINSPNIRLLFDIYHQQVTEGNIIQRLTKDIDAVGHVHVADVPGRHQPGTGELNYENIIKALKASGYDKFVGLEYEPTIGSKDAAASTLKLIKAA